MDTQAPATMSDTDKTLTFATALDLAERIASGDLSAQEVVDAHIRRMEAVNAKLNAQVIPLFEQARQAAKIADEERARGEDLGPLHGVPLSVKESFHLTGTDSTMGLEALVGQKAEADNPLVARLKAAGAIVVGKSNMPQLLIYHESDNPVYGCARNPWNPERTPGGSSGGEGAVLAAGGAALGIGSDIGGSIRVPAHFCGIHGLKPTSWRMSMVGTSDALLLPGMEAMVGQPGPFARSVADLALAFKIMAAPGLEAHDWRLAPVPLRDPADVSVEGLRVAFYTDDGYFPSAPGVRRVVESAATALDGMGAEVEPFTPPDVEEAMAIYFAIMAADGGAWAKRILRGSKRDRRISGLLQLAAIPGKLRPGVAGMLRGLGQKHLAKLISSMGRLSTDRYWQLLNSRTQYQRRFMDALAAGRFDAIVCPPHALPALTHGSSYYLTPAASYSMLYNILGLPAGVVAAGRVQAEEESDRRPGKDIVLRTARKVEEGSTGLPLGVQVVARHWREDVALAVLAALETHFSGSEDYPARPPI